MRNSRVVRFTRLVFVLSLVVSACSGGDDAGPVDTVAPTNTTTVTIVTATTTAATTTTTAATSAAVPVAGVEIRVPFEVPPDAEFDVDQVAGSLGPIFDPYPAVEFGSLKHEDGSLVFSLLGPVPIELCEDLFNALGAGTSVADGCGDLLGDAPVAEGAPEDFSDPDYAAADAAVGAMLDSVVVVTDNGDSVGTGFFISADGYVLTNRHVVEGKSNLGVALFDGRALPASLVGMVIKTGFEAPDVAVLKVAGSGFAGVEIGDPGMVQRGDTVIELGHPGGYGFWLATGGHYLGTTADFITTAPGDVGHSGSPMFTDDGRVVALLWGSTSGLEGEVDFDIDPPVPASTVDVVWTYEELQDRSATRVNTAGIPIDRAMGLAFEIIATGGNVSTSGAVAGQTTIDGTSVVIPVALDPELIDVAILIDQLRQVVLVDNPGYEIVDVTLEADSTSVVFDVLPPSAVQNGIVDVVVDIAAVAPEFVDLASVPSEIDFPEPAEGDAISLAAQMNLDSVVTLAFPLSGHATGFFISEDGYILTNAHNVSDAPDAPVLALLSDGRRFPAELIGYDLDRSPDVAVLKIDATGLNPVEIAEYESVALGDTVFIIGNPGGIGFWVVSAGEYIGALAPGGPPNSFGTTASAAAGNSGSPFFDSAGAVVGLLWGNAPDPEVPFDRAIDQILWSASEFWMLKAQGSAGNRIDVAMATAAQIINTNGNVP